MVYIMRDAFPVREAGFRTFLRVSALKESFRRFKLLLMLAIVLMPRASAQETASNAEQKKPFYLPSNPVAAAYILGRLSNQDLIAAPRSEFVYVALLQRKGLEKKFRLEALEGLAKARKTDTLAELLAGLGDLDKKGEEAAPVLRELSALILPRRSEELTAKRTALENLSVQAQFGLTRQIACAAIVTADRSFEPAWKRAAMDVQQLADLLLAAPLVRDPKLRSDLYPKLEPLVEKEDHPELMRAAITAMGVIPGREAESFNKLAALLRSGKERETVIASLQSVPRKLWPGDTIDPVIETLVEHLRSVAPADRTQPEFINAIQFATDLASLLPAEKAKAINKVLRSLGVRVIVLRTIYEQMLYDKPSFVVEAGKPVEILFENGDNMPHNLVVVTPGVIEEIGVASETMPPEPDAQGRLYVPNSPRVLHATRLLQMGEKEKLGFTAPDEPGDYPYVCTFPGHWRRMTGTMSVVKDLEEYLASHAEPAPPQATEWKLSDLAPELGNPPSGGNPARGQQMFMTLACAQCHKLGAVGYAFGPDLTGVLQRWKGDRAAVLGEILDPSRVIEERYRNFEFELKNGDSVSGLLIKEDAEQVTIQAGASDALIQKLRKLDVKERKPQASSLMPAGLLNQSSKEQILDLLEFVLSGGKAESVGHNH